MYPGSGADRKISIRAAPPRNPAARPSRCLTNLPDQNPRKRDKVIAVQSMKYAGGHGGRGQLLEDEERRRRAAGCVGSLQEGVGWMDRRERDEARSSTRADEGCHEL